MESSCRSDVYGFTTTREDQYFERVLAEAAPDTKVILVTHKDVVAGKKDHILFVRKNFLNIAEKYPKLTLATLPLSDWLEQALQQASEWVPAVKANDKPVEVVKQTIREELFKIETALTREEDIREQQEAEARNRAEGRVVRVTVEAL